MELSVVVPFHNSEGTLRDCLQAIWTARPAPGQVILVNDASADSSLVLAQTFPFHILNLGQRVGRGPAKNVGCTHARGEIVVFIDSDVIIAPNVFAEIEAILASHPELAGVCSIPSLGSGFPNLASEYKSVYMNHILSQQAGVIDYAHGCLQAYRRRLVFCDLGLSFAKNVHCDDIEMGMQLSRRGYRLFLSSKVSCLHKRHYTVNSLLRNDFKVPREFVLLLCRHSTVAQAVRSKRFAHASLGQILGILFSLGFLATLIAVPCSPRDLRLPVSLCGIFLLLCDYLLIVSFIRMLARNLTISKFLGSLVLTIFDQWVMASGILCGSLDVLRERMKTICGFLRK